MSRHLPQLIILISGAVLIIFGIGLVTTQLVQEILFKADVPFCEVNFSGTGFKLNTHYAGLSLAGIGAFLEIVGWLGSRKQISN
jgi:hypothetical protein